MMCISRTSLNVNKHVNTGTIAGENMAARTGMTSGTPDIWKKATGTSGRLHDKANNLINTVLESHYSPVT